VPAPPASAIASFYAGGAFQTFITGASSGCASYTIEGFAVPLGIAEKRNDGSCVIVQPEDLPNNMQTTSSFVAANYDTIMTMVVNDECATSGSSGNGVRTINGINVTSNFLFNSVRASVVQQSSCSGWSCPLPVSQLGMMHEMLHMFRYQQHSNAYQCLSEPSNTLKCTLYEYGDMFDTVGGAKLLAGFRARARYYLGWFGSDEVLGVTSAGTYTISALNAPMAAVPSVGSLKRAAFVRTPAGSTEADGIWVEFIGSGAGNTWNNGSYAGVEYNQAGLFLQKGGYLIDATRQRCGGGAYADSEAWQDGEMVKVTLNAGKMFVDQTTGIKLSQVRPSPDGLSVSFTVEYGCIDTTCYRNYPRIGAGLFGEYELLMDGSCSSCETQSLIDELKAVSSVVGATRKGYWKVSQAEDVDEGSCGQSTFALEVVNLPAGWGKVSYYGDVVTAGTTMHAGSTPSRSMHFALTIPSSAADGNYDMCVLVYNRVSGLQTAKPFRVTLPESGWASWTNNRPGSYSPAPANDCSQYVTCRTGIAGCTAPRAKQGICEREAQADEPGCSPNGAADAGKQADAGNPCFPSEALVTMADGSPRRLGALLAGDAIVAARADGTLTKDTVSSLSLADSDAQGTTFIVLTTASGCNLTLTPTHHVPVGAACCTVLKQAKDIVVGETVFEAVPMSGVVRATKVTKIGTAIKPGLHSPVLLHGTMPIVDGVATSFDALYKVRLAAYGLPLLEATGLTGLFRDIVIGEHRS
jgi:hypothetical protein